MCTNRLLPVVGGVGPGGSGVSRGVCLGVCVQGVCPGWCGVWPGGVVRGGVHLQTQRHPFRPRARQPLWTEWQKGARTLPSHNFICGQ